MKIFQWTWVGILICACMGGLQGQSVSIEDLAPLPEPTTNNAVAGVEIDGNQFVYSFAGMDSTKECGNAHLKCYKFDVDNDTWSTVSDLPQSISGVVATGASTVKGRIYVFGGYHIRQDCSEVTSGRTNIFDPTIDDFIAPGMSMPKPVDDHIQGVWNDSLIYIISGWSNTTNVVDVQIYNPTLDEWQVGTPVPNTVNWKVFGASGVIIQDTIYFIGGAKPTCSSPSNCFKPTQRFRKGIINPNDPTDIEWVEETNEDALGYRMAASSFNGNPIWIGGSDNTYNFDGIAYDESGNVPPNRSIKQFDIGSQKLINYSDAFTDLMDFRGVAKLSEGNYILVGGLDTGLNVSRRTIKVVIDQLSDDEDIAIVDQVTLSPNPALNTINITGLHRGNYLIYNMNGQAVLEGKLTQEKVDISSLCRGTYCIKLSSDKIQIVKKLIKM